MRWFALAHQYNTDGVLAGKQLLIELANNNRIMDVMLCLKITLDLKKSLSHYCLTLITCYWVLNIAWHTTY
jgi:hypothetical protein